MRYIGAMCHWHNQSIEVTQLDDSNLSQNSGTDTLDSTAKQRQSSKTDVMKKEPLEYNKYELYEFYHFYASSYIVPSFREKKLLFSFEMIPISVLCYFHEVVALSVIYLYNYLFISLSISQWSFQKLNMQDLLMTFALVFGKAIILNTRTVIFLPHGF